MNQSLHDLIRVAMLRGMSGATTGTLSQRLDAAVRHVIADLRAEGLLREREVK